MWYQQRGVCPERRRESPEWPNSTTMSTESVTHFQQHVDENADYSLDVSLQMRFDVRKILPEHLDYRHVQVVLAGDKVPLSTALSRLRVAIFEAVKARNRQYHTDVILRQAYDLAGLNASEDE